jgi:RNA polymerase sigma factor (sigma-70 family)
MTEPAKQSDSQLWDRAVAGEPWAFGELFDRHAGAIFAFCVRRTGDRAVAEDLMSATFLHAWRRRADVDLTQGPLPWLYGIAANLVRRHLRGASRRAAALAAVPVDAAVPDPSERIVERLDEAGRLARVMSALRSLPEDDQELFVLCVWQELSYGEAAAALGVPVGTVRSRLSRAFASAHPRRGTGAGERRCSGCDECTLNGKEGRVRWMTSSNSKNSG